MIRKNKGISKINDKLGRDTTTAVSQLQGSQSLNMANKNIGLVFNV